MELFKFVLEIFQNFVLLLHHCLHRLLVDSRLNRVLERPSVELSLLRRWLLKQTFYVWFALFAVGCLLSDLSSMSHLLQVVSVRLLLFAAYLVL
jgi:hypothetical protein